MQQLLEQLKSNPNQLTIITKILQQLLKTKYTNKQKYTTVQKLIKIIKQIKSKLDKKKQQHTYKFLTNVSIKLIQALIIFFTDNSESFNNEYEDFCEGQAQGQLSWVQLIGQILEMYKNDDGCCRDILKIIFNFIEHQSQVNYGLIKGGQFLLSILKYIKQNKLLNTNNYSQILKLLMQIQHFNSLNFQNKINEKEYNTMLNQSQQKTQFKQIYQQLFIDCLGYLQKMSVQQQANVYKKLGEKIFSKLSNPLILSEFLLRKIQNQQQNPTIQIQVLSSLFILVGKYGLQLQKFYQNLQKIIAKKRNFGQSLFQLNNSKRFLKLVQASMRSSKVPFKTILKLSHLILNSAINEKSQFLYWVLSFFVNLVKKHRQLQNHLSQFPQIQSLKYHYSPIIRSLIKQLSKNLNKAQYLEIQDFAKVNCKKLCNKKFQEISKKIRNSQDRLQFRISKNFDLL